MPYAELEDLTRYGVHPDLIAGLSAAEVLTPALAAAAQKINGYLGDYTLPLTEWGPDLTRAEAVLAAWEVVRLHRLRPGESAIDHPLRLAAKEVEDWLARVSAGTVVLTDVIPVPGTSVGAEIALPMASSNAQRGYYDDRGPGYSLPFQGGRSRW